MTICLKASECLTKTHFEVDLAFYVADHMDPMVKTHMEADYKGQYDPRDRHWKTQMRAFRDLLKHAAAAEEKVMSLCKEVRNTAAAALVSARLST